ncbi:MAG: DUF3307 domain-containing protein [Desulfobacteraceae bacterium]|nr:DUF3307 domain-containing protein [Desulfobacteraceae bacterium]MBC2720050.1 DUF3307 domain-containing protein [Desulfobacteraceae bacterium]
MKLFFLLLAAHICGDFFLYSTRISRAKRTSDVIKRLKAVFLHCFFHFILILLWLMPYDFIFRLRAALYISIIHFIIDFSRVHVEGFLYDKKDFIILKRKDVISYLFGNRNSESGTFMKRYLKRWIVINIADQGLHLSVISGFVLFI